jgi:NO-binding membrane sensor protein with MHYT domain
MYFIGNCAIVLGDGQPDLHIVYSPSFTALSFFLPVAVLFIAFSTVGANARPTEKVNFIRVTLGGTLAGLGVCGMHYLGQAGIANYECMYTVSHVVGAAVIAVAASIGALITFFYLRTSWTSTWWKRAGCASLLTLAVSGMHWLAAVGTYYRLKANNDKNPISLSRHDTVAVVIVFVSVTILVFGHTN